MTSQKVMKISTVAVRGSGPGCGKDTVSDAIAAHLQNIGFQTHRSAFADTIREDVSKITDIPVEVIRTTDGKNIMIEHLGITVGKLLQVHGWTQRKLHHPEIWVESCMKRLPTTTETICILSDVRFRTEQKAVKDRNGIVIQVISNRPIDSKTLAGRSLTDPSERDLDGIPADYTIENNGTLEELNDKVKTLVDKLFSYKTNHSQSL